LEGHSGSLYAINENEKNIYTGGSGNIIAEWPKKNIDQKVALAQIDQPVYQFRIYKGLLFAGQYNGCLLVIDLKERKILKNLQLHNQSIFDIYINDQNICSAGGDGTLVILNHEYELIKRIEIATDSLRNILIFEDKLFIASSEPSIIQLNLNDHSFKKIEYLHEKSIFCLANIDNQYLISGGRDAQLIIQDIHSFEVIHKIPAHLATINDLSYNKTLGLLASASKDKTIKLWDIRNFKLLKVIDQNKFNYHGNSVNKILWSNDDKSLISVSDDRLGIIWNIETE
jgi:WD40 repeat protein